MAIVILLAMLGQGSPRVAVDNLYRQVVAAHPVGIPQRGAFSPYLSAALLRKIDDAAECEKRYYRAHKNDTRKPSIDWLEFGLFTGGNERVSPGSFRIEGVKGSEVRVRLEGNHEVWFVAVKTVKERGGFAVDDVVFLDGGTRMSLSGILRRGCGRKP